MKNKARYITIGGTFLCALGIGYFMQNAAPEGAPAQTADEVARADFKPLSQPALPDDVLARLSDAQASALVAQSEPSGDAPTDDDDVSKPSSEDGRVEIAALTENSLPDMPSEPEMPAVVCDVTATATVEAGAMVRFDVSAPCAPDERVVVHHNGMMFTTSTDSDGFLSTMVPALAEVAVIMAELETGEGVVATAEVSSVVFYDRVVLQWSGPAGFQLHAREYGAEYGSQGHVWSGAARDVSAAALGQGGFITLLGDAATDLPRMAEVYSFPSGTASQDGKVALSVEAQVTPDNCGQDIEAQAIELSANGQPRTQYVTLAVPDCASIGDFLVLNNLVDDLKIATN